MRLSFEFTNILGAVYHRGTIRFGPDGNSVFSPVGNKVIIYDLKASRSNALPLQVNYNIERICIHPKNTIMLAASEKSYLYIVSLTSGKLLHLKQYKSFSVISHLSFSPDGRYYCVCGGNLFLVYVTPGSLIAGRGREIIPFRLLRKFRVNHDNIADVTWSADSNYLCVANDDLSLNIFSLLENDGRIGQLRGHTDSILNCYFANRTYRDRQLYSLTKNCQLFVWDEKEHANDDNQDEKDNVDETADTVNEEDGNSKKKRMKKYLTYYRSGKHYLKLPAEPEETKETRIRRSSAYIKSSDYNPNAKILVIGYNTGHYSLYEMPDATLIHNLDSDFGAITSISINPSGDWIAFGSSIDAEPDVLNAMNKTQTRLMVWEWQSKSHILDHIGSGASMSNMHECVSYSLDGTHVVSGNLGGRIKVWSALTGETVAAFGEEHNGPIKAIKFAPNKSGKVVVSASLDGTLRAYDLNKFKNFRTFKSPIAEKTPEFICLDIDSTGKFLEYLTGHEGPVSSVAFCPVSNLLVSTSWDRTVRIWNLFEGSKCMKDTITLAHDVITVAFRPDGNQFAVSLGNGQIAIFNPHTSDQLGAPIEGVSDLGTTQLVTDISRENDKHFLSLHYSADGSYLIGAGKSNFICIYHAQEKVLIKKIAITFNMSMDGIFDYISNRRRREFGYNLELLEQRQEERGAKPILLPGVRKGDLGERNVKPVIAVNQIAFSPTMRSFAAASTEGVLIYSLDVSRHFDPYKLAIDVNPTSVQQALKNKNFGLAIVQCIQLNNKSLFREIIEKIPLEEMEPIVLSLELDYVKKLLDFIGQILPGNQHVEYYLLWVKRLLYKHGVSLKNLPSTQTTPIIRSLHQHILRLFMDVKRNCDYCRYSIEFLTRHEIEGNEVVSDTEEMITTQDENVSND